MGSQSIEDRVVALETEVAQIRDHEKRIEASVEKLVQRFGSRFDSFESELHHVNSNVGLMLSRLSQYILSNEEMERRCVDCPNRPTLVVPGA